MDDYLSYDEYLDGYVVTGFTGDQNVTTVTIPATHLNKTVYGVRGVYTSEGTYSSVFGSEYNGNIATITIENGVSFVGIGAFANCDNLSSVVLPNSIQYIDNGAFYNCVSLPSVNIPSSVTTIGDFAFGNCAGLVSVTLPTTPITISRFAFTGCTGLSNYSAMALSRYGISPSVATPKLVGTDALAVFLDKLKDLFVVINGDEYNLSLADSVTFDQNSGMTFNGLKLRDVNDVTKVSDVNLVLPIVAGDNVSVTQSNGKILISSTATPNNHLYKHVISVHDSKNNYSIEVKFGFLSNLGTEFTDLSSLGMELMRLDGIEEDNFYGTFATTCIVAYGFKRVTTTSSTSYSTISSVSGTGGHSFDGLTGEFHDYIGLNLNYTPIDSNHPTSEVLSSISATASISVTDTVFQIF